ncbi:MAG TPA: cell division protein FtsZ [archaeon]|nr:cell division protein FtsZ [archaeon]
MDFIIKSALENNGKNMDSWEIGQARIVIVGAGGAGNNTADRLYKMGINGAKIISINTDKQHLDHREADAKLLIGRETCKGLGAGGFPDVGRQAAEENKNEIKELIKDADMVFIVAGMGGGTGTGSASVVARIAKEMGAIVIGTVTMPFKMEKARVYKAESGLYELRQVSDTVIVIDNNRLLEIAGKLPISQAFTVADELVSTMIKGIVETIALPSLVNLDYADVKAIMSKGGVAVIGVGEASSDNKAEAAIKKALTNPLLDVDYRGATGALIHVTGGPDMTLEESNLVGEIVTKELNRDAQVIWGARIDDKFEGKIRVMTIITGVQSSNVLGPVNGREPTKQTVEVTNQLGLTLL